MYCNKHLKMQPKILSPLLFTLLFLLLNLTLLHESKCLVKAQIIPAKFDGFVHGNPKKFNPENILIEAFFDPVCPDSRDAWPPLKQLLHNYGSKVSLVVHPFPLPYHDNAFATSRAVHIVNGLNSSSTYPLWESFFKHQEQFYNKKTSNKSRTEVLDLVVDFVTKSVGHSYYSSVKSGFTDRQTDLKTRVSFKYGCSRGVIGTPAFFVNGFILPDIGSPVDYSGWKKIIDPLVKSKREYGIRYSS